MTRETFIQGIFAMRIKGLDAFDNEIVNLLLKDGRISYSEIAERIGLTRTAVKNRITELEKKGVIEGYKAIINPHNVPEMMTFVVNIETTAASFDFTKEYFKKSDETLTIVQTTGNCHLLAICVATDIKAMRDFINTAYKNIEGIQSINAHAVLDIVKGAIIPEK